MDIVAFKLLSALLFLVLGLVGGFLPLKISKLSQVAMHVAYAFAGGILAAVAVVHMLGDASGDLEDAGTAFAKFFPFVDPDDADFPLGNALFLIGFFLICSIEALLHHKLGAHAYDHSGHGEDQLMAKEGGGANAGGWATLVGLSIHSVVEGVAAGAVDDATQAAFVVLAIAVHKGFAAFANGSVNLPLVDRGQRGLWIALVVWFGISGPLGMIVGLVLSADLDGTGTAIVTALAAGTLLSVGVTEMLLPAFKDAKCLAWKLFAASMSMLAMSLLAVWA